MFVRREVYVCLFIQFYGFHPVLIEAGLDFPSALFQYCIFCHSFRIRKRDISFNRKNSALFLALLIGRNLNLDLLLF